MIIVPDVHGRTFWKKALQEKKEGEKIIFLGDYLDSYSYEGITLETTFENFKELSKHFGDPDIIFLLGNHDFMTYLSEEMGYCRTDFSRAPQIRKIFQDNLEHFKISHIENFGDKTFVFSHAPILKGWVENNSKSISGRHLFKENITIQEVSEKLNWSLRRAFSDLTYALNQVSSVRGGWNDFGSCVWADLSEMNPEKSDWGDSVFSVFGHTQLREDHGFITPNWACLDCRKAFRLDENTGEINEL